MITPLSLPFSLSLYLSVKNQTNKTQSSHLPYRQKRSRAMVPCWAPRSQPCCPLDHAEPGPVHPSTNKQACSVWLTAGSRPKRWPCLSKDCNAQSDPLSHTTHRDTGQAGNIGFSWLKESPGGLTFLPDTLKKHRDRVVVYTETSPALSIHPQNKMVPKCWRIRANHHVTAVLAHRGGELSSP